jgi:hypothetical protein
MKVIKGRFMLKSTLLAFAFLTVSLGWTQDRFESGDLKGFTRSSEEHIINYVDVPFTVREVKGSAVIEFSKTPADGVLFELKGPEESDSIVSTTLKTDGKFRLKHIRPGKYRFKATRPGFQSVVGTIIVSPKTGADQVITLEMKPGV